MFANTNRSSSIPTSSFECTREASIRYWTGLDADAQVMRQALLDLKL
ncbi:hypothetical protein [Paraburkholderia caffeinitolerans]